MKRILVVDDDRASCELLREIFATEGWETESALSPEEALSAAARGRFDLVVSDINLESAQTGLDILRELRETCPVILVTGWGIQLEDRILVESGVSAVVAKPFTIEEVLATVERVLRKAA